MLFDSPVSQAVGASSYPFVVNVGEPMMPDDIGDEGGNLAGVVVIDTRSLMPSSCHAARDLIEDVIVIESLPDAEYDNTSKLAMLIFKPATDPDRGSSISFGSNSATPPSSTETVGEDITMATTTTAAAESDDDEEMVMYLQQQRV